jgi:hypothetical protein
MPWPHIFLYKFNVSPETEVAALWDWDGHKGHRKCTLRYNTLTPLLSTSISPLTSRFPLTMMAAGGFGLCLYHHLWTDYAPSKRITITPSLLGMMPSLGFVPYHQWHELLFSPPTTTSLSVGLSSGVRILHELTPPPPPPQPPPH